MKTLPLVTSYLVLASFPLCAQQTYYVDSEKGDDAATGLRADAAWKSLEQVNRANLQAGDTVMFRRGCVWRGQLVPKSGEPGRPVTYTAYGTGDKPVLQGSLSRSAAGDWVQVSDGIWATRPFHPRKGEPLVSDGGGRWSAYFESPAKGRHEWVEEGGEAFNRVVAEASGNSGNKIQLWGPRFKGNETCVVAAFTMRSSAPFSLSGVEALRDGSPWTCALAGTLPKGFEAGTEWKTAEAVLLPHDSSVDTARLHLALGARLPPGAKFEFKLDGLWRGDVSQTDYIGVDVGILILNHGAAYGVKKWRPGDLKDALDYWYDADGKRVYVRCDANPAEKYASVELALTRHIVNQGNRHDIVYDGLAVRYGAAHGFGGGMTKRLTIRNCDVYWIGGGLQFFKADGSPVRYGNGIEFWDGAEDHLVEGNRLWEIYDAALTNQGNNENSHQVNITYRSNVVWNCEYSFEFWNRPAGVKSHNIVFEGNTCVNAGFVWSHAQRPDPNGCHLSFYHNPSDTQGFIIRNNIFCETTDVCLRVRKNPG